MHEAILPQCQEKFKLYDKHLEDAPANRDMIVEHETKIGTLGDSIKNIRNWIIGSSATIIIAIIGACFTMAVTWGKTLEKVERLDKMHQTKYENNEAGFQKKIFRNNG